jgi:RND family efflux transporter MFP subunit
MPPMPVQAVTLTEKPVDQVTDFIATVKSRRSTTIQPQVEGFITRIAVRSGDRVRAGAVLVEIDSGRQQAAVASLESEKASRQADVQYARQQVQRAKTLFDAGATSQQELEQAQTAVQTSEAQLAAIDAQIREQQVNLGYHRVTAPAAGIVGDIPNRVGDRVTNSTIITTVDQNEGLEVYINVPVQQATQLKPKMMVRLLDEQGKVTETTAINFIAPSVDDQTQSVLVKAPLPAGSPFRTDQFVRAQVVWNSNPGLTVPLTAVTRVNGQYFAYVAEKAEGGMVARQRPITLGSVIGNDYVLLNGLKPGEQLIVGGIQKIGDGAPVMVGDPAAAPPAGAAAASGAESK